MVAPIPRRKRGAPPIYHPDFNEQARALCDGGATDWDLAKHFNVSRATLYRWRDAYPAFRDTLKSAKAPADDRVERSLFERATGYSYEAVKISVNSKGEVTQTPYIEHVPPDPTSMIFWLKNRRSAEWRDKAEVEHTGAVALVAVDKIAGKVFGASKPETEQS